MTTLVESYTVCFNKYATFRGRAGRQEYIVFTLANLVLSAILGLIPLVGGIFGLVIFLPGLAVSVRRLHDLNRTGWWLLAPWVLMAVGGMGLAMASGDQSSVLWAIMTCLGGLSLLVMSLWMLLSRGTDGSNDYGADTRVSEPASLPGTPPASATDNVRERLLDAKKMLDDGIITEAEHETLRASIIRGL